MKIQVEPLVDNLCNIAEYQELLHCNHSEAPNFKEGWVYNRVCVWIRGAHLTLAHPDPPPL